MDHGYAERLLEEYVDKQTYEMALQVLRHLPGDVGYNPGSQIVQILGITALDKIDHFIKDKLKIDGYVRYMDDFILIHESRDYLEHCLAKIKRMLADRKMMASEKKTYIQAVTDPILFLGFRYQFTESGKLLVMADPKKIKHEKKKIMRMVEHVKKGTLTKRDVDVHFKAYKSSIRYGNTHKTICRLNTWYAALWEGEKTCSSQNISQRSENARTSRTPLRRTKSRQRSWSTSLPATTRKYSMRRKRSMSKVFYNMAKKNYPNNWNIEMLRNFVAIGRISPAEYEDITGEPYENEEGYSRV